jgi:hypothetical protein
MGIGGNKLYLEENGNGIFLDFGKNFSKYGVFYEEFLKNRDTRGIYDLSTSTFCPGSASIGQTSSPPIYP